ncbi:hypothetical protein M406DRAFT_321257 [Cryphonectria parasitica EP155]|uniref:Uncharacterized protein n=1 Tax=Cryphonectria parasitica (strain ATCC 38755 / EP155) TaxID=660469 RepID=A0A9P4Y9A7_CRYP1|nr:uncharacterized protein M406DRAFT_321257 [Cryphonectria parasitica EP155]KAF3769342.1 hypothetical protein M406DRAFT_321257 [Cryphonectria parasitica EP155]
MFAKLLLVALATSPLVSAHGKVAAVVGDQGGNTTALGIQGGVVPGSGPNSKTEVDTTTFNGKSLKTDSLGETTDTGKLKTDDLAQAMELSGSTLPQVASTINATFHVVTSDGCGPIKAVIDPTGTGAYSQGTELSTLADVPGDDGECPKSITKKSYIRSLLENSGVISKRASNVNQDFNVAFSVPAGTTCTGTINGQSNVCLVKLANNNKNGPFGGNVAIQMTTAAAATNTTAKRGSVAQPFSA